MGDGRSRISLGYVLSVLTRRFDAAARQRTEASIPKVLLTQENVAACRVLLNRAELLRALPHHAVCAEIGVDEGVFTEQILRIAEPSQLHLVDSWGSKRYNSTKYQQVLARYSAEMKSGQVSVLRAPSVEAADTFADAFFDWVYIDTTHAYALTARELRAYAPKVKSGGLIAGHDYAMGNWVNGYRIGVIEAVHEFCVQQGWEFVYLTMEPVERQSFAIRRIKR